MKKLMSWYILTLTVSWNITAQNKIKPEGCPFPPSDFITDISIMDAHMEYGKVVNNVCVRSADTWWLTWAEDGNCYSPFMDGTIKEVTAYGIKEGSSKQVHMGFVKFTGESPMNLVMDQIQNVNNNFGDSKFRYACAILSFNGNIFYGSSNRTTNTILGSFVGFNISTDNGKTFSGCGTTSLFGDTFPLIKMGEPHFVDFGKNMEFSEDKKAYLIGYGSMEANKYQHWMMGDDIFLCRVTPSVDYMNDASRYEFFAGQDNKGNIVWSHQFSQIKPLLSWKGNIGQVGVTFIPALKKYIMTISTSKQPNDNCDYDTYFLESDHLTGKWKLITYWQGFGSRAYFTNIPSKFVDSKLINGELYAWIVYSANYNGGTENPTGSKYAACFRKIKITTTLRK